MSFLLFALSLFSINTFSQVASGTITFKTDGSEFLPIDIVATDLFDSGKNVYNLSGNINQAISFSNWSLQGALAIGDYQLDKKGYEVYGNPSGELNAIVKTDMDYKKVSVRVVDVNGRVVSFPKVSDYSNGVIKIYDPLSNVQAGIYFVQINNGNNTSFRFIKNNVTIDNQNVLDKSNLYKQIAKVNENYKISWSGNGIVSGEQNVEIVEGSNNSITIDVNLVSNETGDVAIEPLLKGTPETNTIIKLTNMQIQDSTYTINSTGTQAIFWNIHVANNNNPTQYKVEITDMNLDGTPAEGESVFLPTTTYIDIYQDENGEINTSKIINLNELPNLVDLTVVARESINETFDQNVELELHKASDSTLIASDFTGADDKVEFKGIEGGIRVYTVAKETGSYTKMNESYLITTPSVISQLKDYINVITTHNFNFPDNTPATAAKLMAYVVSEYNVEFIRNSDEIYLAASSIRDTQIEHLNNFSAAIGFPNGFDFSATQAFATSTNDLQSQYEIFEPNRNTLDGVLGTNGEPNGTSTTTAGKTASNGEYITNWAQVFALGNADESTNHHEAGNKLNIPQQDGVSTRNVLATENVRIQEVPNEARAIRFWYKDIGEKIYNRFDTNSKALDYSQTKSIKDN